MEKFIAVILLILICIQAVCRYIYRLRRGGGCCSAHEPAEKKVRVTDRDKSHYPHRLILSIDGMTCSGCVRRVENALNRMNGVWAKADLASRQAQVFCKQPPDEAALRRTVREAGYTVLSIQKSLE